MIETAHWPLPKAGEKRVEDNEIFGPLDRIYDE